jgi:hypothetical protein
MNTSSHDQFSCIHIHAKLSALIGSFTPATMIFMYRSIKSKYGISFMICMVLLEWNKENKLCASHFLLLFLKYGPRLFILQMCLHV